MHLVKKCGKHELIFWTMKDIYKNIFLYISLIIIRQIITAVWNRNRLKQICIT